MTLPPLFMSRPPAQRFVLVGVVPAVFGAIAGVILGVSAPLYWLLQALAIAGGGLAGGAVFGSFILIAHAVAGTDAKVSLGSAPIFLVVITAVVGALLGALGAKVRAAREPAAA
jgi:Na+/citrate or Na+/malate symporter